MKMEPSAVIRVHGMYYAEHCQNKDEDGDECK
jgi:hypothetical protein